MHGALPPAFAARVYRLRLPPTACRPRSAQPMHICRFELGVCVNGRCIVALEWAEMLGGADCAAVPSMRRALSRLNGQVSSGRGLRRCAEHIALELDRSARGWPRCSSRYCSLVQMSARVGDAVPFCGMTSAAFRVCASYFELERSSAGAREPSACGADRDGLVLS